MCTQRALSAVIAGGVTDRVKDQVYPEFHGSFFSRIMFTWMTPLILKVSRSTVHAAHSAATRATKNHYKMSISGG